MTSSKLSPAAQAVLDAARLAKIDPDWWPDGAPQVAAAALRAAADQLVPEEPLYGGDQRWMRAIPASVCRKKILAIADELEQA